MNHCRDDGGAHARRVDQEERDGRGSLSAIAPNEPVARLLEIQRDLAIGLLACTNLQDCLELLLSSAMRLPGFDCGGVYVCEKATGGLRLMSCLGLTENFINQVSHYASDSLPARLASAGKLIYAMRSDLPPEVAALIASEGLEALAVMPLHDRGSEIAALIGASHYYQRINTSSRLALQSLGALAEVAIASIREREACKRVEESLQSAREHLEIRIAERTAELESSNAGLREKSAKLELAFEASQAGASSWDLESGTLDWDNRLRALYGFENDAPVSLNDLISRLHPDDAEVLQDELAAINKPDAGDHWNHEFRIMHPNLGERWLGRLGRVERDVHGRARRFFGICFDITERKVIEQTLRESEEKYRSLHESMMDGFARVDMDGRITEYNRSFQNMLGYSDDELRRLTCKEITPDKWHDMERRIISEQVLKPGFSTGYEKEYRRKDGSVFPVEMRPYLVRDAAGEPTAMWAIVRDITERKRNEQAMREWNQTLERRVAERTAELHQSEARFRQLAEATFEGIAITENGRLMDGNPQLGELMGYDLSEMIGRSVTDFVAAESHQLVIGCMRAGTETTYEFVGLRKDGSTFPSEAHASMRMWQGRSIRVTALRDLTSVKLAAARLQAQQTELEHAQRLGLVSEVSAGIIHQVGQPLCAMGANLHAAISMLGGSATPSAEVLDIIKDVNADVGRLKDVVVHLRALANPGHTNRVPIDFNNMISDVLRLLAHEAEHRQTRMMADFSPNLPPVQGDPVQLSQVVLNLLHNAFDACGACRPDRRLVEVVTRLSGDGGVEMTVRDRGTGITPDVMDGLFAPFFTTKPEGLGMGLRLSRTIVQAHGGAIEGDNNPDGKGAMFRVLLPLGPDICYAKV